MLYLSKCSIFKNDRFTNVDCEPAKEYILSDNFNIFMQINTTQFSNRMYAFTGLQLMLPYLIILPYTAFTQLQKNMKISIMNNVTLCYYSDNSSLF